MKPRVPRWKDIAPILAAVLSVLLALSIVVVLFVSVDNHQLTQQLIASGNNHHSQTVSQNKQILALTQEVRDAQVNNKATLTTVAALEQQVASVIDGLPAADSALSSYAVNLEQQIEALCNQVGATCPMPVVPK